MHKALPTDGDHDDLEEALREVEIRDVGNLMEYLEAGDADLEELLSSVALDAEQIAAVKEKLNALKDKEQGVRKKKRTKKVKAAKQGGDEDDGDEYEEEYDDEELGFEREDPMVSLTHVSPLPYICTHTYICTT